jgi:hypothetical protein
MNTGLAEPGAPPTPCSPPWLQLRSLHLSTAWFASPRKGSPVAQPIRLWSGQELELDRHRSEDFVDR